MVGGDLSQEANDAYIKKSKMKWPQVKWNSRQAHMLRQAFRANKFPTMILLNEKGEVVTAQGRDMILIYSDLLNADSNRLYFEYKPFMCGSCDKQHQRLELRAEGV